MAIAGDFPTFSLNRRYIFIYGWKSQGLILPSLFNHQLAFQRWLGWKMKHGWLGEAVIVNSRSQDDKMILSLVVSECKPLEMDGR